MIYYDEKYLPFYLLIIIAILLFFLVMAIAFLYETIKEIKTKKE